MTGDGRQCPGCAHVRHRDECRGKAPTGYVPVLNPATGEPAGHGCARGPKPPCRCPYGWCHRCRAVIVGASPLPLGSADEIDLDVDPGFAGALVPGGELVARTLADGSMAVIRLDTGAPGRGWHPAREHACQVPAVTG